VTPIIKSRGGWRRITAAGMITLNTKSGRTSALAWLSKRGMRKEKAIWILNNLKRRYGRKHLVLMWDGLPAHKAKVVQTFIKENSSWLTVHRFPGYSPELNPQEYVWSAVKRKDMGNYCPKDSVKLRSKVYRSLKGRKKSQSFLKGCLKASGLFNAKELGESQ
jgi:transposase